VQTILYSFDEFRSEFSNRRFKRTFLVYRPSFDKLSIKDEVLSLGSSFVHFSSFTPNPKLSEIKDALSSFRESGCDSILAVGGGSAMDVAKAVKYFYNSPVDAESLLECDYVTSDIALFAIPTTAGSGSESTPYSVFYENGVKKSIAHKDVIPEVILLSPEVLLSLPDYVKKTSFMDALSQAIESYWSPISTEESRTYARLAIEGLMGSKDEYLFSSPSLECASEIMTASNFAGRAICITRTSAPHAMSYKLTTTFGIAHGHAVALSLVEVWKYMNEHTDDTTDERGSEYFKETLDEIASFLGCNSSSEGVELYSRLINDLKLDRPKCDKNDILDFAHSVDPSRLKNNPVPLSEDVLYELYSDILNSDQ